MKLPATQIVAAVPLIAMILSSGCRDEAARIAEEGARRQAEQNQSIARVHEHVAAGAKRLAEEDAQARRQALVVQQELQEERVQLNGGWNQLESERQAIADSRRTESFLTALMRGGGAALAGILALAIAWMALHGLRHADDGVEVYQLVVDELTADHDAELRRLKNLKSRVPRLPFDQAPSPTPASEDLP